jgi:hypothetical protein
MKIVQEHLYRVSCSCGRYRICDGYKVKNNPVKMFLSTKHKHHSLTITLVGDPSWPTNE